MKLDNPTQFRRTRVATLEASDFPTRELIEPRLAKLGFELTASYEGTAKSPFLLEALTASPAIVLRTLTISRFEFDVPDRLMAQRERSAYGARFGFSDLVQWASFCRSVSINTSQMSSADQQAYAAFLFHLIGENYSLGLQLNAVIAQLRGLKKSPILSRGQVESFMRLSEQLGRRIDSKRVAHFLSAFTLVEAMELLGAGSPRRSSSRHCASARIWAMTPAPPS
jgi:hypothetical protein